MRCRSTAALAERGQHRGASLPNLIIAATAERAQVTLLHYDADYDLIASVTGQPVDVDCARGSVQRSSEANLLTGDSPYELLEGVWVGLSHINKMPERQKIRESWIALTGREDNGNEWSIVLDNPL